MLFRFTWLAVALGVLGAACLLFWGRRGEAPARPAALPSGRAKILQFYAREGEVARGDATLLCYGVENARAVRITPLAETLTPAFSHCVEVKPEQATHYTLVAEGHDGTAVTQSFTVQVLPPAPRLISFTAEPKGRAARLCYQAAHAAVVTLDPAPRQTSTEARGCFIVVPVRTTTYTLTVAGTAGQAPATRQVVVEVDGS